MVIKKNILGIQLQKMKRVLIAVDCNQSSRTVAEAGYAIGKTINAEIALVHAISETIESNAVKIPLMGFYHGHNTSNTSVREYTTANPADFLNQLVEYLEDKKIDTKILQGQPAIAILNYSRSWCADLIVIGSRRHKGLDRLFITHVSRYIFAESEIPLLIVPIGDGH